MLCKQRMIIIKQLPTQPSMPTLSVEAPLKMYMESPIIFLFIKLQRLF